MTTPNERDPWRRDEEEEPDPAMSTGWLLWLALIVGAGLSIWFLASKFSYAVSSRDDWIDVVRLVGVLALVSSGVVFVRRVNVGEAVRNIAIWVAVAAVLVLGYSFRGEIAGLGARLGERIGGELMPTRARAIADGELRLRAGIDGHFHVDADVNGAPVRFLIDTGASGIVLTRADARRAGFDADALRFTQSFETANGRGRGAPVRLEQIAIGPAAYRDVAASVNDAPLSTSLLGISFLERLRSFEVRGDVMILRW